MDTAILAPTWPSNPLDLRCPADDFDTLLGVLTQLSRKHLLSFRIEVGRAVAAALFAGEPAAFRDHAWNKEGSLRRFAADRREALADLGLSEATLRQCVRAWFVARELPPCVLDGLVLNHLNLLAQVEDRERRALLAQMVVDHGLSGLALHELVRALKTGVMPGDEPRGGEAPPLRRPQPGRVVTRFERTSEELDGLIGAWAQVPAEKRTEAQVARVKAAVAGWKQRIARLEGELG
ncbi:MAG: hypothetical protein RL071_40 [Pseudomonadota bacterium]|jgi:hypothetical protein